MPDAAYRRGGQQRRCCAGHAAEQRGGAVRVRLARRRGVHALASGGFSGGDRAGGAAATARELRRQPQPQAAARRRARVQARTQGGGRSARWVGGAAVVPTPARKHAHACALPSCCAGISSLRHTAARAPLLALLGAKAAPTRGAAKRSRHAPRRSTPARARRCVKTKIVVLNPTAAAAAAAAAAATAAEVALVLAVTRTAARTARRTPTLRRRMSKALAAATEEVAATAALARTTALAGQRKAAHTACHSPLRRCRARAA
jgi:hypothetical protein